ncbi:MAG: hypothetical protein IH782_10120, partial [candidate division NC10 bacterium]|nr:hypothetical protein [candidate division NC10 bacterium]
DEAAEPLQVTFRTLLGRVERGKVEIGRMAGRGTRDVDEPVVESQRAVLVIEDVIDTGLTLNYLLRNLEPRAPASLKVCVLLDKPARRIVDLPIAYLGFELPDKFVVGYGLDYRQQYRNLPFIATLTKEAFDRLNQQ